MKNTLNDIEMVLSGAVSGFHEYILTNPFHIGCAGDNLCWMLGVGEQELLSPDEDMYAAFVHPADRKRYCRFLSELSQTEQQKSIQYRLKKAGGRYVRVSDSMVSRRLSDGTMAGYSVLSEIPDDEQGGEELRFLNDTVPCGFLKYTCDRQPRITYVNDRMLEMLRFPAIKDGEIDYLELCRDNIYLMIPMEERRRFAAFLNRVYTQETPIAGELAVSRCDGTKGYIFGWVTKTTDEQGNEEFQSVCMDITEKYRTKKDRETQRYVRALSEVYDKIFEFDLVSSTVRCLHGSQSSMFKLLEDIPMQTTEAVEKWVSASVDEHDRDRVQSFFREYARRQLSEASPRPPQIRYRALSSSGKMKSYVGIFLKIDSATSLFCCRASVEEDELDHLRSEAAALKNMNENMHEFVSRYADGAVAFEVVGEIARPLYASDNMYEFFGFTKDEWHSIMEKGSALKEIAFRSGAPYESYQRLLEEGEGEFTYYDIKKKTERRIKAICSQKEPGDSSPRYVMLYKMPGEMRGDEKNGRIRIRTFGYFDVFVGDKPIAFRSEKAKELFALLVDRRGGYITSDEAIGFLWEDEPVSTVTQARYRKIALRLKNILEEYGVSDVIQSVDGRRRLVTERVKCDLYDYLSGSEEYAGLFKGSYLTNYSWAETTLGELMSDLRPKA